MSVVLQFFRELGPLRLSLAIGSVILFLVIFLIFILKMSSQQLSVLYSGLELEDSNKIIQELESRNIPYEITGGGTIIKVPEDKVLKMRVALAQEGLPGKGSVVGYEIFDKEDSLGTTNFMQNIKLLRALEGELSRTITNFDKIDKAIIHLVIPKKELFSKERQEPRASVVLKMRSGKTLSKNEIDAVIHLVATSVPELSVKNITLVDTKGNSLKLGMRDDATDGYASSVNDERKISYENRFKSSIESLLEKTVGTGKVIAQVSVDMNFDRIVSNIEQYDPEGAVLRSSQNISESENNSSGEENMDVSVANNIPGGESSQESSNAGSSVERTDETQNFEVSRTVMNKIQEVGEIKKLSVAILVDGKYNLNQETQTLDYEPRTDDELKQIEDLVKVAVGFDVDRNDKITVVNMKFMKEELDVEEESTSDWIKDQLPSIIQTIVFAGVVILVLLTVVRPIALRAFDIKQEEVQDIKDDYSYAESDTSVKGLSGEEVLLNISKAVDEQVKGSVAVKKINDSIDTDAQNSVLVIKRWLNEDNA